MRLLQRIRKVDKCFIPLLLFALTFSIFSLSLIPVSAATGNETIVSDQPEYMQGDTVFILGSGFAPNHEIVVQVIRVDSSIVTGNGTETPGSDIITSDPYGSFIYPYLLDGGPTSVYYGTLTVNAIDTSDMVTVLATTTFLDNPQVGLQGCSRERGDCTDSVTPSTGWADGINHMNGWTSGNVKGWYELEYVPYRLRINPREPSDAKTYYFTVEHDNLRSGVTGVDALSDFYVGAGPEMYGYTEGTLTKNCVLQVNRLVGDNPTTSNPCIVTGPTYSGVNDDGNNGIDEDSANGIDNDGDGKVDEDPPPTSSTSGERRIQYTVAVLFTSADVGHNKKWALYWKAHLATGSSGWPGSSLHAHTSIGGSQDVPIMNVLSPTGADLSIIKSASPDQVTAGGALTYTITVTNNGPASASNISVTDTLPGSTTYVSANSSQGSCSGTSTVTCSLGSLANGASATVTIVVTANTAGTIQNKASVSSSTSDSSSSNNTTPWVYTTVNSPPSNTSNLSITKTDSPDPVTAGGLLTYTITVTNAGPDTATNVTVTDNLPGGVTNINASGSGWNCIMSGYVVTCSRSSLPVGTAPVITITVNAPSSGGVISNSASVTATQNDPGCNDNTATISTTVTASANLSITKTAFPDPVTAGGILTYTVTVANAGPSTATSVVVTDTLPTGTAFLSASGTGWSCGHAAGVVTCSKGTLAVGTAPAITISVTAPDEGGTISNSASVTSAVADPNTGNNNTGSVTTVVTPSADVAITKTAPASVFAGQSLTYTITVTNNGPSTATAVIVADTLPGSVTFSSVTPSQGSCSGTSSFSCNLGSLANNASATVTVVVTTGTTSPVNNTATVTTTTSDPTTGNNSSSISTTVNPSADLSIVKTGPATITAGGALTYSFAVTNNGPSSASTVSVSDTLPSGVTYTNAVGTGWTCNPPSGGVVTCTRSSLALGAAPLITITGTAPAAGGSITNSASVSASTNDSNSGNNSSSASTTVNASADVSIIKSASPNPVSAGGTLTYTITVLNSGPSTAANVIVTDTLPGSVTLGSATPSQGSCSGTTTISCNLGTLTSSASATVTIIVTPNTAGTISNSASVSSSTTDPNSSNNTTPNVDTTVNPPPTVDADVSIAKTGSPNPVTAGGTLTYTISVSNAGPNPATNVTVTDTLPSGVSNASAGGTGWGCTVSGLSVSCTQASLAVGAAPNITITVKAPSEGGSISNSASVTATENDPVPSNNTTPPVITTVNASSDRTITKTGTATVTAGGTITYTVTAINNGPSTATGVQVTDTLPAGVGFVSASGGASWSCGQSGGIVTCNLSGSLAVGSAPAITITVTAPTAGGVITNNVSVSGSVPDPNSGNNSASASTTVNASADVTIANVDNPDPVIAGTNLTYALTVSNNGPSSATGLTVTHNLPPNVNYVSASGTGWACTHPSTYVVSCTRTSLPSGSTAPVINVVVTPIEGGLMSSTASVSATESDPVSSNNSSTATTTVTASSDLSITKTDLNDPVTTGGSLTYSLTITNNGPSTPTSLTVMDNLVPAGVTFVSASGTGWTCSQSGGLVTCSRASLTYNTSSSITLNVTAPSTAGSISNTATVASAVNDPVSGNNSSTQTTTVNPPAASGTDLSIAKTDSPDPVYAGQNLTYTITVTNMGPDAATGVAVTDTLPGGVAYISAAPSQGSCSQAAGIVTCNIGNIGNGANATVAIVVRPSAAGTINNSAGVSANELDPNTANNNVGPISTTVNPSADLSVTKVDSPDPVKLVGDFLTYTITVTNNGPSPATGVTVTDTLPTEVSYQTLTTSQGTCSGTTAISCNIGSLANGASATITITTQTLVATMVSNTASVSGNQNDSVSGNNSATAVTNVGDLSRLINISTRGPVETGDKVMIGGFILGGNLPKTILIRGFGPTLADFGVSGSMTDPYLEVYSGSTLIATNDNWQTPITQCDAPATSCGTPQDIQATGKSACQVASTGCTRDAAVLITLPPGPYTAILRGVGGGTGVGLIGIDDPDTSTKPKLVNISTRGKVLTGDSVMIGGFIIGAGNGSKQVLVRALGPTLADFGVSGPMANPYVELYSGSTRFATNDNWQTPITQCAAPAISCGTPQAIQATGKDSCSVASTGCNLDAAILVTLPPGAYTAIVRGVGGGTGVGLVGIDELGQ